jgi:ABC-type multidrug transport system fused ATPase/permease subunit
MKRAGMIESEKTYVGGIPWRRVARLLAPIRGGVTGMVALSVAGVLVGLVPPLALGILVNALVEHNDTAEGAALAGVVALAVVFETTAYVLSDTMYARNAGRLYVIVREQMFAGARRRADDAEDGDGVASRFISDAEAFERITLSILDGGAMLAVEFVSALVALWIMEPWAVAGLIPLLAAIWLVTRRMQRPASEAGHLRQDELERLTATLAREVQRDDDTEALRRFALASERVRSAEVRLGWWRALNLQGSGGLAKLGPIAVVVVAAFAGSHHAGTLIALYLLAQRGFWGFDGLVDMRLDLQSVRGAVQRCFDLIDTPVPAVPSAALPQRTGNRIDGDTGVNRSGTAAA